MTKRIKSYIYTQGKFGKGFRETLDTENIYISYKEKLKKEISDYGFVRYTNYDACVCGNDIVDIALYAEKYSGLEISHIREGIREKCQWLKRNEPDFYKVHVQNYEPELFRTLNQKL